MERNLQLRRVSDINKYYIPKWNIITGNRNLKLSDPENTNILDNEFICEKCNEEFLKPVLSKTNICPNCKIENLIK